MEHPKEYRSIQQVRVAATAVGSVHARGTAETERSCHNTAFAQQNHCTTSTATNTRARARTRAHTLTRPRARVLQALIDRCGDAEGKTTDPGLFIQHKQEKMFKALKKMGHSETIHDHNQDSLIYIAPYFDYRNELKYAPIYR